MKTFRLKLISHLARESRVVLLGVRELAEINYFFFTFKVICYLHLLLLTAHRRFGSANPTIRCVNNLIIEFLLLRICFPSLLAMSREVLIRILLNFHNNL